MKARSERASECDVNYDSFLHTHQQVYDLIQTDKIKIVCAAACHHVCAVPFLAVSFISHHGKSLNWRKKMLINRERERKKQSEMTLETIEEAHRARGNNIRNLGVLLLSSSWVTGSYPISICLNHS